MTMTTTPALQHTAEPKRCVGIFSFNPFEDDSKLFDTGMRIFIDPVTHDLDVWGPDDEAMSDVEAILDRVIHISGNETKTSDQFIDWCVTQANEENALGMSRLFVPPVYARSHSLIDPSTLSITEFAHSQGL